MATENKDELKHEEVWRNILSKKAMLKYGAEDEKLIKKLWDSYCRKRRGVSRTATEVFAASILWQYSKLNYLWEHDKAWTQKSLGDLFTVRPKTISNVSSDISKMLKIQLWDDRFCRKEVSEGDPLKEMVMLRSGFILSREQAEEMGAQFAPLKKKKQDYFYEGSEWIGEDDEKAARCFRKAIEMDEDYVDAYNGLGSIYFSKTPAKAREYFQKAYELTVKHFNGKWPGQIEYGVLENRQYMRAIHGLGLVLWREGRNEKAMELFKLLLKLNKNDNQGARYLVAALYKGLLWEQMEEDDIEKEERLLEEQNEKHKFWKYEE